MANIDKSELDEMFDFEKAMESAILESRKIVTPKSTLGQKESNLIEATHTSEMSSRSIKSVRPVVPVDVASLTGTKTLKLDRASLPPINYSNAILESGMPKIEPDSGIPYDNIKRSKDWLINESAMVSLLLLEEDSEAATRFIKLLRSYQIYLNWV